MKKLALYISSALFLFGLFHSCKKEFSLEDGGTQPQISTGYLIKTVDGNCQPTIVYGSFVVGKAVDITNDLEFDVQVTNPGPYVVRTDTVNGYWFKGNGSFTTTGVITVRLKGSGKPIKDGIDVFTVRLDTSFCYAAIKVSKDTGVWASYTLQGAPDNCLNATVSGDYIKNVDVDTSNYVTVNVDVTIPGAYAITTNQINGYFFSSAGSFTNTGVQSVKLLASGIPGAAGTNQFSITGGSSCKFPVTVFAPLTITNNDYFPLTKASFWTYDHSEYPTDSLKRVINDTANKGGNQYMTAYELLPPTGINELYFRKAGLNYYEYARVDKYTVSLTYGPQVYDEILFLKEGLSTGDVWYSKEYSGTITGGQTVLLRYQYTCSNSNAGATVNGKAFANVYKIRMIPQVRSLVADWGNTGEVYDYYYARGVGMIYAKKVQNGFRKFEYKLENWLVY